MTIGQGEHKHGFTVISVRENSEIGGTLVQMIHDKTGAQLCWLDNHEDNKLFAIAFKTPPEDDTGVFHILEHSVLCGSEKYPVKEPFVELLKSSMKTFLNAFTMPDMTAYPVSSRNTQDYMNLVSVYLDAVFAPAILKNECIFMQEGWHIEECETGVFKYNGVVFNEMKGAMSTESRIISQKLNTMLFPDSCYGFCSGGLPESIPDLSYEKFTETYRKHYHPSNAYVYLDGEVPLDETLMLLDAYFSRYEKKTDLPCITLQSPRGGEATHYYEVSGEDSIENKGRLTLSRITGTWQEQEKAWILSILNEVLAGSNEAPLPRAILDAGIAKDFSMSISDSSANQYETVTFRDIKDGMEAEAVKLLKDTIRRFVKDGIPREEIAAAINEAEYAFRSIEEPAALTRFIQAMSIWLYGGDPMRGMTYNDIFSMLRSAMDTDIYEKTLESVFLRDDGWVTLHTLPSKTLGSERETAERTKVSETVSSWTGEELDDYRKKLELLANWHEKEDSAEAIAMLPVLDLSQLPAEPEHIPTLKEEIDGIEVWYHPVYTHGIVYFTMYLSLNDLSLEQLSCAGLMTMLLGELDTNKHTARELERLTKTWIGELSFAVKAFNVKDHPERCRVYMTASCGVIRENFAKAVELVREILTETRFDSKERILESVLQKQMYIRQAVIRCGDDIARNNTMAYYSASRCAEVAAGGYIFLRYLQDVAKNFGEKSEEVIREMGDILKKAVCRKRLLISVTADEQVPVDAIVSGIPEGVSACGFASYTTPLPKKLGIVLPTQSNYSAQSHHLGSMSESYSGAFSVASRILTLNHYWNNVRVKGGAYGTGILVGMNGGVCTYSYRDPSPDDSIGFNREASRFLKDYIENGGEIEKYIIASVSAFEPLLSPAAKGTQADMYRLCGITGDDEKRIHREMLNADPESIMSLCPILDRFADDGAVCVVGNEAAVSRIRDIVIQQL